VSVTDAITPSAPAAMPVDGSNGLLLEIDGKIVPNYGATMVSFDEGDVVNGKVVRIDKDEVLVDIGYKAEGVIPSNELSIRKSVDPTEEVALGEEVDALVLTKEDAEGRLILSKKRARFEKAWRRIEIAADSGEPVEGSVIEVVKGGLILDLGVRGFLPASLVDIRRVHNLDEFMGQTLECKVIELNRSRNNVVLSRRAVLEEERKEVREQILGRLEPGQVVEGKISNIVDFGAFVDLDGIDGLIHISELSWSHVNHPSEVVAIGDTVRIKVLDIDRNRQRISLGLKQTQEDPWQRVISTHRSGDVLEGAVTKVVAFGAFVEILPGVEGLVHISELADHHVENPSEVVEPGTNLNVKILEIDEERRRLSLSIKRVEGQNMPMQGLGEQVEANGAEAEGSDAAAAGPVAETDSSSSQAAGEEPISTPPADDTSEASGSADVAVEEPPAAAEPVAEEPAAEAVPAEEPQVETPVEEPEAVAEEPAAEEAAPEVEAPAAEEEAPAEETAPADLAADAAVEAPAAEEEPAAEAEASAAEEPAAEEPSSEEPSSDEEPAAEAKVEISEEFGVAEVKVDADETAGGDEPMADWEIAMREEEAASEGESAGEGKAEQD
jgi:small subunit ribosomal protein S1